MRLAAPLAVPAFALLALTALAALSYQGGSGAAAQETTTIQVGDLYFCDPSNEGAVCETIITSGDTVEWQWTGSEPHTTTECGGDLDNCQPPHLWDSGQKSAGTFAFTFDSPGAFVYRCQIHPGEMRGQITVQAAQQPTATPTATPVATASATATPAAGSPTSGAVPATGGAPPAESGDSWPLIAASIGLAIAGAAGAMVLRRRA